MIGRSHTPIDHWFPCFWFFQPRMVCLNLWDSFILNSTKTSNNGGTTSHHRETASSYNMPEQPRLLVFNSYNSSNRIAFLLGRGPGGPWLWIAKGPPICGEFIYVHTGGFLRQSWIPKSPKANLRFLEGSEIPKLMVSIPWLVNRLVVWNSFLFFHVLGIDMNK